MRKMKFKPGDKVRILDGSKIKDYAGGWSATGMGSLVGTVQVISDYGEFPRSYKLKVESYQRNVCWDERGLELVSRKPTPKIVITTDGKDTKAVKYEDGKKVSESIARCAPEDKFNFNVGAEIVFKRLLNPTEQPDLRELLKTGVFGKVSNGDCFVVVNDTLVYNTGGFDRIEDLNKNLCFPSHPSHQGIRRKIDVIYKDYCFNYVNDIYRNPSTESIIWERR